MAHLLHIDSSADIHTSRSRELTQLFARSWLDADPTRTVTYRDLHRDPLPHLADAGLHYAARLRKDTENPTPESEALQALLINEVAAADLVVIGAPMYNWSLPSTLKAWIDHVHVLGTTAPFDTPDQPFAGIPVVAISPRGLTYAPGTPDEALDHTIPPLTQVLGKALGMHVEIVTDDFTLVGRIAALDPKTAQAAEARRASVTRVLELAEQLPLR
jgi:FMN-dependent NADH-azoreductase